MSMQHAVLALLFLVSGFSACKKINAVRPPCETEEVVIPQDTSYLSTPLIIPTRLIEEKLNRAIGRDIVNDDDFGSISDEGKKDQLKLKITRLTDIKVHWENNIARYQAPLLVLIEREIVSSRLLPMPKSLALKTEFSLQMVFETAVDIGADWKLEPSTKFVSFEWLSEVKILGGLINVKNMVERRLLRQMPRIVEKMDEEIRAGVHLGRAVGRVWQQLQKPMVINRKKQVVWLKINPIRFEMGAITTEGGNILIEGLLAATTETLVGDNPAYTVDSTLPPLLKRRALPDHAYVYMLSEIPYEDINASIGRKLVGKQFNVAGRRIRVKGADIRGCGNNLVLHLKVSGGVIGDIYFQGSPQYEPDSQQIVIQNFDFDLRTQEVLLSKADWLLHSVFKDQLKDELSLPLAEEIVKIPEAIMRGIECGRTGEKIDVSIEQWDFRPQQIWVRPSDIATLIIVNARVRVKLEEI